LGVAHNDNELEALRALGKIVKQKLCEEGSRQSSLFSPEELRVQLKTDVPKPAVLTDDDYQVDMRHIEDAGRVINGIHDIYGKLYSELGLSKIFSHPSRVKSSVEIFKHIVFSRIANPESKRATVTNLSSQFGVSLNLDQVYRMMDKLDDKAISKLNDLAYQETSQLFKEKIDVIFFDATTLYFESFTEDEFKRNGYSKDLKFNQPQVVLALMVTTGGLPIGYQAFSGDTFDGNTLLPALRELKGKYALNKVVFVADSGMFNKANLLQLEEEEFDYIVGARIKNVSATLKEHILDKSQYHPLSPQSEVTVARFEDKGRILVVSYSPKRARKDAHDREKGIEKLRIKLSKTGTTRSQLSNRGYRKYLELDNTCNDKITINEEKLAEAHVWDGLKGFVISQSSSLSNEEILKQYNNLWQVEQSFRVSKHDLKIRPIYHWKPRRVKAHLAISFVAYLLVRHLEYRVRLQYKKLSPAVIQQLLLSVQTTLLYSKEKGIKYAVPTANKAEVKNIYRLMGVERKTTPYILTKTMDM
jgi:transposase